MMDDGAPLPAGRARVRCSEALGAESCTRMAAGEAVLAICGDADRPHSSMVYGWRRADPVFDLARRGR